MAIEELQRRVMLCRPGSDDERTTEHAINLCLSEMREDSNPQRLVRNTLRNSAHILARSQARERNALRRYRGTHLRVVATSEGHDIVDPTRLDDGPFGDRGDMCKRALGHAADLGAFGPQFIQRLLAGDTITEASTAVNISRASGYRAVRRLRDLLLDVQHLADTA